MTNSDCLAMVGQPAWTKAAFCNHHRLAVVAWLCLLLVGCEKPADIAPVTGTVMLRGAPMDGARVVFVPVPGANGKGISSEAQTNADGTFELLYTGEVGVKGAVIGMHTVCVEDSVAEESRGKLLPRIDRDYSSPARSPLSREVKPEANDFLIEIPAKE